MLTKTEIIQRLRAREPDLRAKGVMGLFLFGSYARNTATAQSDIDLFLDQAPTMGMEFFDVMDVLAEALPIPVDVTTRDALHRLARPVIETQAERIF